MHYGLYTGMTLFPALVVAGCCPHPFIPVVKRCHAKNSLSQAFAGPQRCVSRPTVTNGRPKKRRQTLPAALNLWEMGELPRFMSGNDYWQECASIWPWIDFIRAGDSYGLFGFKTISP